VQGAEKEDPTSEKDGRTSENEKNREKHMTTRREKREREVMRKTLFQTKLDYQLTRTRTTREGRKPNRNKTKNRKRRRKRIEHDNNHTITITNNNNQQELNEIEEERRTK
jgi:hypothetical protein